MKNVAESKELSWKLISEVVGRGEKEVNERYLYLSNLAPMDPDIKAAMKEQKSWTAEED